MKYCTISTRNWLDKFQTQSLNNSSIKFNVLFPKGFLNVVPPFLTSFAIQVLAVKLTSWNSPRRCAPLEKAPDLRPALQPPPRDAYNLFPGILCSPCPSPAPPRLVWKDHKPSHQQPNTSDFCAWLFHANFYPPKDSELQLSPSAADARDWNRW